MVTGKRSHFSCAANFLRGRKCIYCGSFKVHKTARGYAKCGRCGKTKSLVRLRREIAILVGFYQLQPAYRLAIDLAVDVKVVSRVYQRMREALYHLAVPHGVELACLSVAEAAKEWKANRWKNGRTIVLVSTPEEALAGVTRNAARAGVRSPRSTRYSRFV